MTLFQIYYEEKLQYEEFVEASSREKAVKQFMDAISEGTLENYDGSIEELSIELAE
jgi:uncharacterized protein YggL (DUF469 family)